MTFPLSLLQKAENFLSICREQQLKLVTAESCTGGLLAGLLTEIPGSSDVVERGFITYSNIAKTELLHIPSTLISTYGAVSKETACAMASGALTASHADISISITGIAGPGGGTEDKPVGLVHFAVGRPKHPPLHQQHYFSGDRNSIRLQAVGAALALLSDAVLYIKINYSLT